MILREPHPALRTRCDFVQPAEVHELAEKLRAAMAWSAEQGSPAAGLAAPQIGVTLRMFTLDGFPSAFVNPRPLKVSSEHSVAVERCLSLPDVSVAVRRPTWVKIGFLDEHGANRALKLHGWDARAALHELDHLDGILITDRRVAEAA